MSDPILEALGQERRRSAAFQIPREVQAARDAEAAEIRRRELLPNGGGMIPSSAVLAADPVLSALQAPAQSPESYQIPGVIERPPYQPPSLASRLTVGPIEAGLSMVTGAASAIPAQIAGIARTVTSGKYSGPESVKVREERAREVMDSLTYRPRSQAGQEVLEGFGNAFQASKIPPMWPVGGPGSALASIAAGPSAKAVRAAPPPTAAPGPSGGLGSVARGASTAEQARALASNASPEIRAGLEQTLKKGGVNLEVLQRRVEADSLPVKIHLMKGQATQDPGLISHERNVRGKEPRIVEQLNAQNKALIENVDAIRDAAAPDVFATSKPELGNMLIDAYRTKDAQLNAQIGAKYQALRDANGGQFPLDSNAFVTATDKALHKQLLYDFVPGDLRRTLDRVKGSGMTFENFESLRTNLARIQRTATDGNARAVAGVIRDELEALPMPKGAEHLKPLADNARAAAKARFQMLEADPAYKAVVRGNASADNFISNYVLRKDTKQLETMMQSLGPEGRQAVARGVVDHLRESAIGTAGNFSQAGYNKALEKLRPKLGLIFEPEQRKQIETLGNVARYVQAQPAGSFVNNSNTLVGALAMEGAKNTLESVANYKAAGIPLGSMGRKFFERRAASKDVDAALDLMGGVLLKDVGR